MQKIWLAVSVILIGLGIYTLYGYLRLESAPIEEESVLEPAAPANPVATPGVKAMSIPYWNSVKGMDQGRRLPELGFSNS